MSYKEITFQIPESFECFDEVEIYYIKEDDCWSVKLLSYDGGRAFRGQGSELTEAIGSVLNKINVEKKKSGVD